LANTEPQAQVDKDENLAEKDYEDIGHNRFDEHHTRHMIASRGKRSSHDFRISGKLVLFFGFTKNVMKLISKLTIQQRRIQTFTLQSPQCGKSPKSRDHHFYRKIDIFSVNPTFLLKKLLKS